MGSRVWTSSKAVTYSLDQKIATIQYSLKPISKSKPFSIQTKANNNINNNNIKERRRLVIIVEKKRDDDSNPMQVSKDKEMDESKGGQTTIPITRTEQRLARKRNERKTYLVAAVLSSVGVSSASILAVYYRFYCQMQGGEFPLVEMFGTFSLAVGSAVGMEFWARWAHRALWHASLWNMHESHHRPRDGPFEVNDVFAIVNAVPAIALFYYGLFNNGLFPGLCFGAGLGITMFGMAYMFVHDGLVHRRFPVGPIANVPYLKKVAAAHRLHHSEKFNGVPYGLFLGPKEVEAVGGREELEKEIEQIK